MNNRIFIYDIRQDEEVEPITIVLDTLVEDFYWIYPIDTKDTDYEEGAYVNSKQLIVFTKSYLEVKLYSLDCTHTLWTLAKPISTSPIYNPEKNIWSLALHSKSFKSNDTCPIVYHFCNTGSTSNLLYRFKLPCPYLSDFELNWCNNLLYYFNCNDSLYGFSLKIFNSLAVNRKEFNKQTIPTADPLIQLKTGENIQYFIATVDSQIVVINVTNVVEFIVIKDYKVKTERVTSFSNVWRQKFDGEKLGYVKGGQCSISPISKVVTDRKILLLQTENTLMIFENLKPLHFIYTQKIHKISIFKHIYVTTDTHSFVVDHDILVLEKGSFIQQDNETKLLVENGDWNVKPIKSKIRTFEEEDTFLNKRKKV